MRARDFLLLACVTLGSAACWDSTPSPQEPADSVPVVKGVIASEPVTIVAGAGSIAIQGASTQVSYISLPAGTFPTGVSARIRNVTAGTTSEAITIFSGGFDPVSIVAAADDELEVAITDSIGAITLLKSAVPKKRPPAIVRTTPPKGRTDVALKVVPAIVFSEPIDARSLAGEVRLVSGNSEVVAEVALAAGAPWIVEVAPRTPLQPLTTYQLTISGGVSDVEGDRFATTQQVTFTTGPALEFLGRVAFVSTRDGSPSIYLANGDGSGVTRLIAGDQPAWSPDGRQIVYQRAGLVQGPFSQGAEIRVINVDGTGDRRLAEGVEPAWSPDGNRIAFADSAGISVINVDGSGLTQLIRRDVTLRAFPGFRNGTPAWSPDGTRIAFEHSAEDWPQRIAVMNADGSAARIFSPSSPSFEGAECNPSWSPDGTALVLWNFFVGIAVMDASGAGTLQRLFFAPLVNLSCFSAPEWSADGAAVVFTYFTDDARRQDWRGRIYVVPRGPGGTPHQLIPDVAAPANPSYTDRDAAWSRTPR